LKDWNSSFDPQKVEKEKQIMGDLGFYFVVLIFLLVFLSSALKILREYERAVVFTLGRFSGVKGPGLIILVPGLQQMVRVDMRMLVHDVPTQDVISQDNVSVKVNAVLYFRVVDANRAINKVENYMEATSQLAQTTLRSVLGKHELDDMLSERDKLNHDIQALLDNQTEAWGIKVSNVEIKHVDIDESMVRAIAKQAEAERERRAKIINAEGELQAAEKLTEAAKIMAQEGQAIQLRYLAALQEIANNRTNTIVFPFPIDQLGGLIGPPSK
jgi:regulator of protease activity HflC (stomatin/prohibitin superfamily)